MNRFSVRYCMLLALFSVSCVEYAAQEAASAQKDIKSIPTQKLIAILREKSGVHTLDDLKSWSTREDIVSMSQESDEDDFEAFARTVKLGEIEDFTDFELYEIKSLLSVLFGLRPLGQAIVKNEVLKKNSILYEILQRPDCPLKFLFIPRETFNINYVYNTQCAHAEHDAYLLALHDAEAHNRPSDTVVNDGDIVDAGNTHYESVYIDGKMFSYPEQEIEGYIGSKNFKRAKSLGEAWLARNKDKTLEQLKLELWQQIQECLRRTLLQ